jgi:hypothetical protein
MAYKLLSHRLCAWSRAMTTHPRPADAAPDRESPDVLDRGEPPRAGDRDVASYIADLTAQLAVMARGSRHDFLAYLLEVARLEAATIAGGGRATPNGSVSL